MTNRSLRARFSLHGSPVSWRKRFWKSYFEISPFYLREPFCVEFEARRRTSSADELKSSLKRIWKTLLYLGISKCRFNVQGLDSKSKVVEKIFRCVLHVLVDRLGNVAHLWIYCGHFMGLPMITIFRKVVSQNPEFSKVGKCCWILSKL